MPTVSKRSYNKGVLVLLAALAALVTFWLYFPSIDSDFVNWDDYSYVRDVPEIRTLDRSLVVWSFSTFSNGNWHPLTWLSLALDYRLWSLDPRGYHLHNIVLHSLNVFMVVLFTCMVMSRTVDRLKLFGDGADGKFPGSRLMVFSAFLTGVLFGIHPLHVESVVWVSERKDLLCALFYLLSLVSYLRYRDCGRSRRAVLLYFITLTMFALSLLSKPMAVTLPIILVMLDLLMHDRVLNRRWVEKVPFFLMSLAMGLITIRAQDAGKALKPFTQYPLYGRIINAVYSYVFYLGQLLFPHDLSPFYPYPDGGISAVKIVAALFIISIISAFCVFAWRRGNRTWSVAWACYLISLLPVIGLIQVGDQAAADRYVYLPSIPFFILISLGLAGGVGYLVNYRRSLIRSFGLAALSLGISLLLVFFFLQTRLQMGIWKDSLLLWSRVIDLYPGRSAISYVGKGNILLEKGDFTRAFDACEHGFRLKPDYVKALECMAEARLQLKDYEGAIRYYSSVLLMDRFKAAALNDRAVAYMGTGEHAKAREDLLELLRVEPGNMTAYYNLACIYSILNNKEEACRNLEAAVRNGFSDLQHINNDRELDNIRDEGCYRRAVGGLSGRR